jgi:hypothetical protein
VVRLNETYFFQKSVGGRETAGRIVDNWYNRGRSNRPRMERAAENMEQRAQRNMPSTRGADD